MKTSGYNEEIVLEIVSHLIFLFNKFQSVTYAKLWKKFITAAKGEYDFQYASLWFFVFLAT